MRRVGVREFKNEATAMMSSGETIVIERHGKPIGFFVPIETKDRRAGRAAVRRFDRFMADLLARHGIDEEDFAREFAGDTEADID